MRYDLRCLVLILEYSVNYTIPVGLDISYSNQLPFDSHEIHMFANRGTGHLH